MESKISEANSHDEIFISVGDILIMAISYVYDMAIFINLFFVFRIIVSQIHFFCVNFPKRLT
jgi:hypothetical protein